MESPDELDSSPCGADVESSFGEAWMGSSLSAIGAVEASERRQSPRKARKIAFSDAMLV